MPAAGIRTIRTLLIANRGEIAVRIARTARRMGIRTVAVYSEADRDALHVALADEARLIGPAPARDSYLSIEAIIAAARASGADAIHPGYGFLSENPDFAEACAAAGLIFVGPPAPAIRAMGSKSAARALMERAGVPLVPGYHGEDQKPAALLKAAAAIGFPVLIKASAGGGGKGMKVVRSQAEFGEALASAKREALAAFGDDRMLIERYLTRPRHIEMQVFADRAGHTIHLFERDCSIQRRHQKVVEEAPAPGLDAGLRAAMGKAAVAAAKAIGYVGAGTVEFIVEDGRFHFMEMNTRLQVEHPVTEAITGLDLVEWQIRVAEGHDLPLTQDEVAARGHAVEARLYAEDPDKDFLPQTGRLVHAAFPDLPGVRVDTGVRSGDTIGVHYDPMIGKIIAHGADRAEALRLLSAALDRTELAGIATNRRFLKAVVDHPAFAAGEIDTGFIQRHRGGLIGVARPRASLCLALAALALALDGERRARDAADRADPFSPWSDAFGWRLNRTASVAFEVDDGERRLTLSVERHRSDLVVRTPDATFRATATLDALGQLRAEIDGVALVARAIVDGDRLMLPTGGDDISLRVVDPTAVAANRAVEPGRLASPMPGTVIAVSVAAGEAVAKGAQLVVVEAMKMEHAIRAPADGRIAEVRVAVGDLVEEGQELVVMGKD
jgi:3-methylcrotonyl-CoA carboxylase alpha subunit